MDAQERETRKDDHARNNDDKYWISDQSGESTTERERQDDRDAIVEDHI